MAEATDPTPSPPTSFSLANRSLKLDTPADLTPHIAPLAPPSQITTLNLSGNTLGVPAAAHLASLLPSQKSLHTALLSDIFTSRLLSEIPPALSFLLTALLECPQLHTIDLSDNAFGLNTVAPLVDFLSQHLPLQHLILQNNGLGPAAGAQVADALTALAAKKEEARKAGKDVPDLETVICGRNRLENGSTEAWARCFRANGHVRTVKMVQNGIRQEGITVLLERGLGLCGDLQVLDLQDNTFTHVGARAMAGVLGAWGGLRELGVGDCLLGRRGGKALFEALGKGGKGLRVLRAQYNELDAAAIHVLCQTAKHLETLRRVEINGNKFSEDDEGVEGLRELLETRKEDGDGDWEGEGGLDELSDLEEESEVEDEDEEEGGEDEKEDEEEKESKREVLLKDAEEEESRPVAQKEDGDVDALADALGMAHVE